MGPFAEPLAAFGVMTMVSPQVLSDWPSAEMADGLQMNTMFSCSVTGELARAFGVRA